MKDIGTYLSNHFYLEDGINLVVWPQAKTPQSLAIFLASSAGFKYYSSSEFMSPGHWSYSELWLRGFWSIRMLSLQVFYGKLLPLFISHLLCDMCMLGRCFAVRFSAWGCTQMLDLWQPRLCCRFAVGSLWSLTRTDLQHIRISWILTCAVSTGTSGFCAWRSTWTKTDH